jgi:hypothetical protein
MNFCYLVANLDKFFENVGYKREKVRFIMQKNQILEYQDLITFES